MGGDRCWVPHCPNWRSRTKLPHCNYFKFPVLRDERCRKWLKAVGYEDLVYLPKDALKYRHVCSEHFRSEDFSINKVVTHLLSSAIPSIFPPGTTPLSDEMVALWPPHTKYVLPPHKQKSRPSKQNIPKTKTPDQPSAVTAGTDTHCSSTSRHLVNAAISPQENVVSCKVKVPIAPATPSSAQEMQKDVSMDMSPPPVPSALQDTTGLMNSGVLSPSTPNTPNRKREIQEETGCSPLTPNPKRLCRGDANMTPHTLKFSLDEVLREGEELVGLIVRSGGSVRVVPLDLGQGKTVVAV